MINNSFLSLIGLARKAGFLSAGSEAVESAIKNGKSKLIIIACDISLKTEKEFRYLAKSETPVKRVVFDTLAITKSIGTKAGIISINNIGFAKTILKKMPARTQETEELPHDD